MNEKKVKMKIMVRSKKKGKNEKGQIKKEGKNEKGYRDEKPELRKKR